MSSRVTLLNKDQMLSNAVDMYNIGRISRAKETVPELYVQTDSILKGSGEERSNFEQKLVDFIGLWVIEHEHLSIGEQAIYKIHFRGVSIDTAKKVEKDNYGVSPLERSTRYLFESMLIADFKALDLKLSDSKSKTATNYILDDETMVKVEAFLEKYTNYKYTKHMLKMLKISNPDNECLLADNYLLHIANYVYAYDKILEEYKKFFVNVDENKLIQLAKDAVRDFLFTGMNTDTVVTYNGSSLRRLIYNLYTSYNAEYIDLADELCATLIENDKFFFNEKHINKIKAEAAKEKKRILDFYIANRVNPNKNGSTINQMISHIYSDNPMLMPYDLFNTYQQHDFDKRSGDEVDSFKISNEFVNFFMYPLEVSNTIDNTQENTIGQSAEYMTYTLNLLEKANPARKPNNRKMKNIHNNLDFIFKDIQLYGHINYGAWRDIQRHRSVLYNYTDSNSIVEKHLGEVYKFTDVTHNMKTQKICKMNRIMVVPFLGIMDEDVLEHYLERSGKTKLEYRLFIDELRADLVTKLTLVMNHINRFISQLLDDTVAGFTESNQLSGIEALQAIIWIDSALSSFLQLKDFKMKTNLSTTIHVIKERITKHGNPMYRLFALNLYRYIKQNTQKIPGFNEYFDTCLKEEKDIIDNICREYIS